MPTKYKAITEMGIYKDNMTTQEALNFRCDNEKCIYVGVGKELLKYKMVAYEVSEAKEPEAILNNDKNKEKFISTLSTAQTHDIEHGFKSIAFKKDFGFVLVKTGKIENENGAGFSKMEMLAKMNKVEVKEFKEGLLYDLGGYFVPKQYFKSTETFLFLCSKSFQITISLKFDV